MHVVVMGDARHALSRRAFVERLICVVSAALFALFGIREDVGADEVVRNVRGAARALAEEETFTREVNDMLKQLWPQKKLHDLFYRNNPAFAGLA